MLGVVHDTFQIGIRQLTEGISSVLRFCRRELHVETLCVKVDAGLEIAQKVSVTAENTLANDL